MPVAVANFIREPERGGKFVILRPLSGEDDGIVAFSDFGRDFQHRDIVRRWERTNHAALGERRLKVAGGGWWKYEGSGRLIVYGNSGDFGRFDPVWLRRNLSPGMVAGEREIDVR